MHHRRAKTINNHACVTKTARDAAKIPDRSYLSEVLRRINLLRAMNVVSRPDGMQAIEFTFLILNSVLKNDTIIQKFVFRALPFSIQYTETSIPITESLELKRRINLWKNRQVYIYRQREEKRQGSINIEINPAVRG